MYPLGASIRGVGSPLEIDGVDPARFDGQIFNRGRVDHFSLQAGTYADFEKLRQRLVREGAATGEVTDFGVMLSFCFKDPDGLWTEVSWWKDGPDLTTLDAGLVKDPIAERNARSNVAEAVTSSAVGASFYTSLARSGWPT